MGSGSVLHEGMIFDLGTMGTLNLVDTFWDALYHVTHVPLLLLLLSLYICDCII